MYLSLSGQSWRTVAREPSIVVVIMPYSLDTMDIYTILIEGYDRNGTIDISGDLVTLASWNLQLAESLEALPVLRKNGIVPTPLVDVASEGAPEGRFCDVRVSESLSQFVLVSVAEAESEVGNVPRTL